MDGKRSSSERSSSEYTLQRARAGIAALSGNLAAEMYITGKAGENIPSGSKNYAQSWIKTGSVLHFHKLVLLNLSEMGGIIICHWEASFYIFMSASIKPHSHLFLRMYL